MKPNLKAILKYEPEASEMNIVVVEGFLFLKHVVETEDLRGYQMFLDHVAEAPPAGGLFFLRLAGCLVPHRMEIPDDTSTTQTYRRCELMSYKRVLMKQPKYEEVLELFWNHENAGENFFFDLLAQSGFCDGRYLSTRLR